MDHQLRALIVQVFDRIAIRSDAQLTQVSISMQDWCEALKAEVTDPTVTDLSSFMRFFYNLAYMNSKAK